MCSLQFNYFKPLKLLTLLNIFNILDVSPELYTIIRFLVRRGLHRISAMASSSRTFFSTQRRSHISTCGSHCILSELKTEDLICLDTCYQLDNCKHRWQRITVLDSSSTNSYITELPFQSLQSILYLLIKAKKSENVKKKI